MLLLVAQAVERFVIGKKELGEVAFIDAMDLRGVCLDDIVSIEKGRIQVYGLPGGAAKPPPQRGLNVPALLTFRCAVTKELCWICMLIMECCKLKELLPWPCRQMHVKQNDAKSVARFRAKLTDHAAKLGGVFVHYDASAGKWLMKVDQF